MNITPHILSLAPLFNVGGSVLLSWAITVLIICVVVSVIVWAVTKVAGPPSFPEQFRWIIWAIVLVAIIIFVFAAFGIGVP